MRTRRPLLALAVLGSGLLVAAEAGAQRLAPDSNTLFFVSFDGSFLSAQGDLPLGVQPPTGVTLIPGLNSNAAAFAVNNLLQYTNRPSIFSTNGTLDFWMRPHWDGSSTSGREYFDYRDANSGMRFLRDGATTMRLITYTFLGGYRESGTGAGTPQWKAGEWHHIAFTWATNRLQFYTDGRLISENTVDPFVPRVTGTLIRLGSAGGGNWLDSDMDEVHVSSSVRSRDEIQDRIGGSLTNIALCCLEVSGITSPVVLYPTWQTWEQTSLKATSAVGVIHIAPKAVTWSSSDTNVAVVDAYGTITAVSGGQACVSASLGGATTSLLVQVRTPVSPPTHDAIDPLLATPATNCVYELPVLMLLYLPTTNGVDMDYSECGYNTTVAGAREHIRQETIRAKFMLEEGSRFRGYKAIRDSLPEPRPSMGYRVIDQITVYEPMPRGVSGGVGVYYGDYGQILARFNGRRYVEELGVRDIWIWGYHHGLIVPVEWYISTPMKPDLADYFSSIHAVLKGNVPVYEKTFTLYHFNYTRSMNEFVHNHGHRLEGVMSYMAMRQDNSQNFFWTNFVGPTIVGPVTNHRCGWTHMPPNTSTHYDYWNGTIVSTDIEDWRPAIGAKTNVSVSTWNGINYPWPSGYAPGSRAEPHWYMYWMQSMPGFTNNIPHTNAQVMTDWWAFTGNWDDSIEAGMGLRVLPADLAVGLAAPTSALEEIPFQFRVAVTNLGLLQATNITLRDRLPAGLVVVSATSSVGLCATTSNTITCTVTALASGASFVITAEVRAVCSGPRTNTVLASAPWQELDARDNRATAITAISYDNDGDGMPNAWERRFFDNITNAVPDDDDDGDGADNLSECLADTDPTTNASCFRVAACGDSNCMVRADVSTNRSYILFATTNLVNGAWWPLQTNEGTPDPLCFSNGLSVYPSYYKLRAEPR